MHVRWQSRHVGRRLRQVIPGEDLRTAMVRGFDCLSGLNLAQLEDVAYFAANHPRNTDFSPHEA